MSMSVEEKLSYLKETKTKIKEAINNIGGSLTDDTTFIKYSDELEKIMYDNIIPQSTLDELVVKAIEVNGEEVSN